jgi:hypothetical protein
VAAPVIVKPGDFSYFSMAASGPVGYGAYVDLGYDNAVYTTTPITTPPRWFNHTGHPKSGLVGGNAQYSGGAYYYIVSYARVYDTGSFSYENDGIYHFLPGAVLQTDTASTANSVYPQGLGVPPPPNTNTTNGAGYSTSGFGGTGWTFNASGLSTTGTCNAGDVSLQITSPPYPRPLRGIQVKIRVMEPDSRQIREVTVEQEFLPK